MTDRQKQAKKLLKGGSQNVDEQRCERRKRLIEKFKALRIEVLDKYRNLNNGEMTYSELLAQLKKEILATFDKNEIIAEDETSSLLADIEQEQNILELELQNIEYEKEVESITNHLMSICDICDDYTLEETICEKCTVKHFSS